MSKTGRGSLLASIFEKIAPQIGAAVLLEPWGIAGQITYYSGRKRYFKFSSVDLNSAGASDVAKDKDFSTFFMKSMGYKTIEGDTFFDPKWAAALGVSKSYSEATDYSFKIGFPVLVKPNSGAQGQNVEVVYDEAELRAALAEVFSGDRVALVQRVVIGKDYRIVVLDDEVIAAYERLPLKIEGDGDQSIGELLVDRWKSFVLEGRHVIVRLADERIDRKLRRHGLDRNSILKSGDLVRLLDNANLSAGGTAIDVSSVLHQTIIELAIKVTRDMGLRFCGVDVILQGLINEPLDEYVIVELNAAPGLDHFALMGERQRELVEDMYLAIIKNMERGAEM